MAFALAVSVVFGWLIHILLSWLVAVPPGWAHSGVSWGVFVCETSVGLFTLWLFSRGAWQVARVRRASRRARARSPDGANCACGPETRSRPHRDATATHR